MSIIKLKKLSGDLLPEQELLELLIFAFLIYIRLTRWSKSDVCIRKYIIKKKKEKLLELDWRFVNSCLKKWVSLRPATLLKRRRWHRCFSVNFAKFLRKPFFIAHLWWLFPKSAYTYIWINLTSRPIHYLAFFWHWYSSYLNEYMNGYLKCLK